MSAEGRPHSPVCMLEPVRGATGHPVEGVVTHRAGRAAWQEAVLRSPCGLGWNGSDVATGEEAEAHRFLHEFPAPVPEGGDVTQCTRSASSLPVTSPPCTPTARARLAVSHPVKLS